jgi:hypothetical protein
LARAKMNKISFLAKSTKTENFGYFCCLRKKLKDDDYQLLNWRIFQIYFTEVTQNSQK